MTEIVDDVFAFSNSLAIRAAEIEREHEAACGHMADALDHAIKAGQVLLDTKDELGHGQWLPWLQTYCPKVPVRTAQLYMQLAIHADEIRNTVAHLSVRGAVELLAKKNREARVALMKDRRSLRELELADATLAASQALGAKLYGVVYADPRWRYDNPPMGDVARQNEQHYPSMTLEAIKALPVPAADDCALFLWATVPLLPEAIDVMKAWGFTYKSASTWVKDKAGTGYWVRGVVEHLLIGRRGDVPAPGPGDQFPGLIEAPRGRHSEKPDIFAEHIERLFPHVPKLEMFAREARDGWDVWGNEVSALLAEAAE